MVVGEGFEPSKSMTADLQSAPFGRSGTPPGVIHIVEVKLEMVVGEGFEPSKSMTADLQETPGGPLAGGIHHRHPLFPSGPGKLDD